jgi:hypothetical protein
MIDLLPLLLFFILVAFLQLPGESDEKIVASLPRKWRSPGLLSRPVSIGFMEAGRGGPLFL